MLEVQLSDLCDIRSGGTPARGRRDYYGGSIPWAKIGDLNAGSEVSETEEHLSESGLKAIRGRLFPPGTLLFAIYGSMGKMAFAGCELATNQAILGIQPLANDRIDLRYLYHYLSCRFDEFQDAGRGVTQKNLSATFLRELKIPLPGIQVQRRIAAILDKADDIRRKREEALSLADEFLKSAFLEMFGDPVKNPKGWELVAIGDVCERVTVGIVVKPASYYVSQGVPALRSLNVKEGHIDQENLVYFTEADNKTKLHKTRIWQGDVVVVRSGQPGKAAIVPIDLDGANAIDILITTPRKKLISSPYLCSILNSPAGRRLVLAEERGQIQKHLNVKSLKEAKIPLPPLNEVEKFTEIFEQVEMSKKALELASIEAQNLASSLYQRAFRGEL